MRHVTRRPLEGLRGLVLLLSLLTLLAACSNTRRSTSGTHAGPPLPRSVLEEAHVATESGLAAMTEANEADKKSDRIAAYNRAIEDFRTAERLYLEHAQEKDAQRDVVEEELAKIDGFLKRCYRDRPVADE